MKYLLTALPFVAALLPATSNAATIAPTNCNACTEIQFETKAISLGAGMRYLYDFAGGTLRKYQVSREPKPGGGFIWEAIEVGAEQDYIDYFDTARYLRSAHGSLQKTIAINLPSQAGTGHTGDSVFSIITDGTYENTFGAWLAGYLRNDLHLPTRYPEDAEQYHDLINSTNAVDFIDPAPGEPVKLTVVVTYEDGEAVFELGKNPLRYKYVPGTAIDSDGHNIPENSGQIRNGNYNFAGGTGSSSYNGFLSLMTHFNISLGSGNGAWSCGTASGGGMTGITCVLVR